MTGNVAHLLRNACSIFLAFALVAAFAPLAHADDDIDRQVAEKRAEADEHQQRAESEQLTAYELQQQIEERQATYSTALNEVDAANAEIEANEKRLEELESALPEQERRTGAAARDLYKFQQESFGFIDVLLSATSLSDFIIELEYVNRISQAGADEIRRLSELRDEIDATQVELRTSRTEAEMRAEDARVALLAAQEAQAEVQQRIEDESRMAADIAAMAEELAKQPRDNDQGPVANDGSPIAVPDVSDVDEPASVPADEPAADEKSAEAATPAEPSAPAAESDADAYVRKWGARIDAYLSGSPLAGQGKTFAKAAYEYGVDPRFSPAISFTESSKGLYCFLPHNAWGWGSSSWSSWEEAIYAHVAGLARGYGGQISVAGAKKYCPPNWELWYNRTLGQMQLI